MFIADKRFLFQFPEHMSVWARVCVLKGVSSCTFIISELSL